MSEWFVTTERNKFGGFDTYLELYSGKKLIATLKPKILFYIDYKLKTNGQKNRNTVFENCFRYAKHSNK